MLTADQVFQALSCKTQHIAVAIGAAPAATYAVSHLAGHNTLLLLLELQLQLPLLCCVLQLSACRALSALSTCSHLSCFQARAEGRQSPSGTELAHGSETYTVLICAPGAKALPHTAQDLHTTVQLIAVA